MKEIKAGIVGVGNMGFAHLSCIRSGAVEGMQVTAACDISPQKRAHVQVQYPDISLFSDYRRMIDEGQVDCVIVAVPHPLHGEIAAYALEKGKHTLVEKPVDISVSKARRLNAVAEQSGKVFGIMFNQRTNGLFAKAREIVESGQLGALKRSVWIITNWYRTQAYYNSGSWRATWAGEGGGVLLNQAPHNLDLWQWICGMPDSVTAFCNVAKFHDIEVEDEATLYTTYPGGATGVFITSTGDYPGTNRLEITGTKGKLLLENGVLKHWRLETDEREFCKSCGEGYGAIPCSCEEYTAEQETAHRGILQNFADAIRKGTPLLAPGVEGIRELTISNAAYLSQWLGNVRVELPLDTEAFDSHLRRRQESSRCREVTDSSSGENHAARWQIKW